MASISLNSQFLRSAARGDLESLEKFLKAGANILATDVNGTITREEMSESDPAGKNALHLAVAKGQERIVEYLTQEQPSLIVAALVNGTDNNGNAPLTAINYAEKVSEKIFNFLLSAGAKFDHVNRYKLTCIHYLATNPENASFLKLALDSLAVTETLDKILHFIPSNLVQLIGFYEGRKAKTLNCQAELPQYPHRMTPLHQAISWKNKEAVALLKDGTDLSLKRGPKSKTLKEKLEEFERTSSEEVPQ